MNREYTNATTTQLVNIGYPAVRHSGRVATGGAGPAKLSGVLMPTHRVMSPGMLDFAAGSEFKVVAIQWLRSGSALSGGGFSRTAALFAKRTLPTMNSESELPLPAAQHFAAALAKSGAVRYDTGTGKAGHYR